MGDSDIFETSEQAGKDARVYKEDYKTCLVWCTGPRLHFSSARLGRAWAPLTSARSGTEAEARCSESGRGWNRRSDIAARRDASNAPSHKDGRAAPVGV